MLYCPVKQLHESANTGYPISKQDCGSRDQDQPIRVPVALYRRQACRLQEKLCSTQALAHDQIKIFVEYIFKVLQLSFS